MAVDTAFVVVVSAGFAGLGISVAIERLLQPVVPLGRHWAAWALHAGIWLLPYGLLVLLLGRPGFAMAAVSAFLLMLVLVNNAKVKALREPFVFQDYEYFTDALRHPRLYIPFLGWGKFIVAAAGFVLAVSIGLWGEPVPESRFTWSGQGGGLVGIFASVLLLLLLGSRFAPDVVFKPERDLLAVGFLTALWRYAQQGQRLPEVTSPFAGIVSVGNTPEGVLPHRVSVQSESFFDARSLWPGIRTDVLTEFDQLRQASAAHGRLAVPAWGANTVRTEFAFLSGLDVTGLGVHRFNPYRAVAAGMRVSSLASYLKRQGYRTICIHPYPASFYQRNHVFPGLGFDEFIDIRAFADDDRYGPYTGDLAVGRKIAAVLAEAQGPTYIHAITMENHGPLHLERVRSEDIDRLYTEAPPPGCDDLTIYLRHLRNADQMLAGLRETLQNMDYPASLCWFGDHVPIMPTVYDTFGAPQGDVEYLIWSNWQPGSGAVLDILAHELALRWVNLA